MAEERLEEIRQQRLQKRQALIDAGVPPYPAEARRSHTIGDILKNFTALEQDAVAITVVGRALSVRRHGGVAFIDVQDQSGKLQLQITRDQVADGIFARLDTVDAGDFIQAAGQLTRTQRGVQTLQVRELHVLAKSIRPLPSTWYGLKDHEARFRQREVDMLLNVSVRDVIALRSRVITWLRQYFINEGYVEVATPVLQPIAGGAIAKPFSTTHNALNLTLYLRIAAELHLKRALVGGFEKVFEIGPRFRNEGIDRQHNPEFTMLESQWAYADYEDLMDFTEEIISKLVTEIVGTSQITWQGTALSFAKPFARVRYVDVVSKRFNTDILADKDPATYLAIFKQEKLPVPDDTSYVNLVDELYKELIRPSLVQPTLLYDYPAEMAPLAKASLPDPRVAEKFQFLIAGMELSNCYTELNDPVEQREKLEAQLHAQGLHGTVPGKIDEEYLAAMEYGMPPNAGWSLGIDRMVMLLADVPNLRDTIAFPLLKPEA